MYTELYSTHPLESDFFTMWEKMKSYRNDGSAVAEGLGWCVATKRQSGSLLEVIKVLYPDCYGGCMTLRISQNSQRDFPGSPVVKTLCFQCKEEWVQLLVKELRSQMLHGARKKKKNNKKRKPHRTVHHRMNFTVCKLKKNSFKFQEKLNATLLRVGEAGNIFRHRQRYSE